MWQLAQTRDLPMNLLCTGFLPVELIIGIVITVAVVEWFFERRRLQTRGRQLAWDALHAVEHAVWVWQGGPREVESDRCGPRGCPARHRHTGGGGQRIGELLEQGGGGKGHRYPPGRIRRTSVRPSVRPSDRPSLPSRHVAALEAVRKDQLKLPRPRVAVRDSVAIAVVGSGITGLILEQNGRAAGSGVEAVGLC